MANEKKLDCVILGLLSHEDLTGYEIKKRMDTVLSFFWGASFGSIYPTLKGLVEDGWAVKSDTTGERKKIRYSITDKGRAYLRNWLEVPVEKDEVRYETLLKLFFAGDCGAKTAIRHIENFEAKIRGGLLVLQGLIENLENVLGEEDSHLYYLLTARFGAKVYEAHLAWCEEVKEALRAEE